jgi:hypothetical protein
VHGSAERDEELLVAERFCNPAVLVVGAPAYVDNDELAEARAAAAGVGGDGDVRARAKEDAGSVGDDANEAAARAQRLRIERQRL